ncbi:hypothetical protein B0H16DRAFT_1735578 [Mycena metata]|uniref:Uncharacterized protein n=1 Tax=Mycena metata TaxID=1033252 RepID=A0AAD7HSX7_9AGAR|nr:hypothetical protein B0H16DRAFT_1735578 [Mycena metata]
MDVPPPCVLSHLLPSLPPLPVPNLACWLLPPSSPRGFPLPPAPRFPTAAARLVRVHTATAYVRGRCALRVPAQRTCFLPIPSPHAHPLPRSPAPFLSFPRPVSPHCSAVTIAVPRVRPALVYTAAQRTCTRGKILLPCVCGDAVPFESPHSAHGLTAPISPSPSSLAPPPFSSPFPSHAPSLVSLHRRSRRRSLRPPRPCVYRRTTHPRRLACTWHYAPGAACVHSRPRSVRTPCACRRRCRTFVVCIESPRPHMHVHADRVCAPRAVPAVPSALSIYTLLPHSLPLPPSPSSPLVPPPLSLVPSRPTTSPSPSSSPTSALRPRVHRRTTHPQVGCT